MKVALKYLIVVKYVQKKQKLGTCFISIRFQNFQLCSSCFFLHYWHPPLAVYSGFFCHWQMPINHDHVLRGLNEELNYMYCIVASDNILLVKEPNVTSMTTYYCCADSEAESVEVAASHKYTVLDKASSHSGSADYELEWMTRTMTHHGSEHYPSV